MHKAVDQGVKTTILEEVKNGTAVKDVAAKYGITAKAIYNWMSRQADNTGTSSLEVAKLRKENAELKEIIGMFALEKQRSKKNTKGS